MKKSDLKDGMILEVRKGTRYLLTNGVMRSMDSFVHLNEFNDDLTCRYNYFKLDIVKVYKDTGIFSLSNIFDDRYLELIWERKWVETLTKDQHDKLKASLTIGLNWIAKDGDGKIYVYDSKPNKGFTCWIGDNNKNYIRIKTFELPFIKWEENEPRKIEELLKLEIKEE